MPVANLLVAAALDEIADRLEIEDANAFRVRAYRNAARTVRDLARDVKALAERGETVAGLPGIGADLGGKIAEIALTGSCDVLRDLRHAMPSAFTELLRVPGLGPKRVKTLWHALGVQTPAQVLRAARDGRIRALRGFGATIEGNIERAVAAHVVKERRIDLAAAGEFATAIVAWLGPFAREGYVAVAGSYRRMRETVGDLDVVVGARDGRAVAARFAAFPEVEAMLAQGATRASARLHGGLQVDLRVVPEASFGAALVYFTGSKAHNIALRRVAQAHGLKINEYGVFRGSKRIAGATEASVYGAVGLPCIAPELREDRGELDAARDGRLPSLVELRDLAGDLHAHTDATDGRNTLDEMVAAARAAGLAYLAITDHSPRQSMAHGLDPERLARQGEAIARLNARLAGGFRVLRGIEVDILNDGELDLPDTALARLDLVIAAVHGGFNLSRARQTERILRALESPHVTMLAHPTGRLIGEREPCDVDMLQVVRKAKACHVLLEVNAQPQRLDLADVHCHMCRDEGVQVAVDSDAHAAHDFANLRYGIGQARRGWLGRDDVANTRPLAALLPRLRQGLARNGRVAAPA